MYLPMTLKSPVAVGMDQALQKCPRCFSPLLSSWATAFSGKPFPEAVQGHQQQLQAYILSQQEALSNGASKSLGGPMLTGQSWVSQLSPSNNRVTVNRPATGHIPGMALGTFHV